MTIYLKVGGNVPSWVYQSSAEEVDNAMEKVVGAIRNFAPDFESNPIDLLIDMASDGSLIKHVQKYCDELGDWYGKM